MHALSLGLYGVRLLGLELCSAVPLSLSLQVKNEFMAAWDGLRTKEAERILVLAATNRPFDLDEAVVRRFPRR